MNKTFFNIPTRNDHCGRNQTPLIVSIAIFCCSLVAAEITFAQFNNDFYSGVVAPQLNSQPRTPRNPAQNAQYSPYRQPSANNPRTNNPYGTGSSQPASKTKAPLRLPTNIKALLFSVNNYEQGQSGLSNLSGCNNDIFEWDALLKEPQGSGRLTAAPLIANSSLFTYSDDPEVSPQLPTYNNFMNTLKALTSPNAASYDRLLIIFSGHGVSAFGKSFLCPLDAVNTDFRTASSSADVLTVGRANKLIPVSDVIDYLRQAPAKEVLLVLDACRDAGAGQEGFMREFQDLVNKTEDKLGRNFAIITSCSMGQTANECVFDDTDHGAFTYHFIDGLVNCKADFAGCYDGKITLVEAYNYAYAQTAREARRLGAVQTPEIFVSSNSDAMCLAAYDKAPKIGDEKSLTDLQFLTRTGHLLADNTRNAAEHNLAVRAFNCVLDNTPNNTLAHTLRGGLYRMYGQYAAALSDCQQAGLQLSLNIKQDIKFSLPNNVQQVIKKGDTVNVTMVEGDKLFIDSVNEVPLQTVVKLDKQFLDWSPVTAATTIRASVMQNQSTRYPGGQAGRETSPGRRGAVNGGSGAGMGFMKI